MAVDKQQKLVEITRHFAYKVNAGNYETRDFFMAFKIECEAKDAAAECRKAHEFCKLEVLRSVKEWKQGIEATRARIRKQNATPIRPNDDTPF